MEAADLYSASTKTVSQLLGEAGVHFYIPAYQRPYAWKKPNVEKLIADISYGLRNAIQDKSSFAFIGTIITIKDTQNETIHPLYLGQLPAQVRLVIDGQQRLATLSMILLRLHNQLRTTLKKSKSELAKLPELSGKWVEDRVVLALTQIARLLHEERHNPPHASSWYPKIIRAYLDAWTVDGIESPYTSPLAKSVATYQESGGFDLTCIASEFRLSGANEEPHKSFRQRYADIAKMIGDLLDSGLAEDGLQLPSARETLSSETLMRYLQTETKQVEQVFPDDAVLEPASDLVRLLGLAHYLLNSVALTSVIVSRDEYAFAVFDSLNTTGKPLTPYETLRPLVMKAVGLGAFGASSEKQVLDRIDALLGHNEEKNYDSRCERVAIDFALAESGRKLSRRHDEQRSQYKKTFALVEGDKQQRLDYLASLETVTSLRFRTFAKWQSPTLLGEIEKHLSVESRLCLSFLVKFDHSITIPLLSRFVARVLSLPASSIERADAVAELGALLKGITAFSCLFRSTRLGTSGIDDIYRDLMSGTSSPTSLLPLCRFSHDANDEGLGPRSLEAKPVLEDLRRRLTDTDGGGVANRSVYVDRAGTLPLYEINQPLTRFLLLVAQHNSTMDFDNLGMIREALPGVFECLDTDQWISEDANSVEHVAPQAERSGWPADVYKDQIVKHTLGNLTLCPRRVNSVLSNRPWDQKRPLFKALSSQSRDEARPMIEKVLAGASDREAFLDSLRHIPYLTSIGHREGAWDRKFIEERSRSLAGRVWDALYPWLAN